MNGLLLSERIC